MQCIWWIMHVKQMKTKKKQFAIEIGSLVAIWADILSSNNDCAKHLRTGNEEQINCDFKTLVREMILDFTKQAFQLLKPNARPLDINMLRSVQIYMVVSKKAGRHYEQTKRHLQEYAFFLNQVGNATPGTENASLAGASCIWSGIHLGTYLDQIL